MCAFLWLFWPGHMLCCVPGVCVKCNKAVYGANQACQAMGSLYHDSCFTCSACSKYTPIHGTSLLSLFLTFEHFDRLSLIDSRINLMSPHDLQAAKDPVPWIKVVTSSSSSSFYLHSLSQRKAHNYLGITVLCCWCLVSGRASHSSSPHKDTSKPDLLPP